MFIRMKKTWYIPEREAAPEEVYLGRRQFLRDMGYFSLAGGLFLSGLGQNAMALVKDEGKDPLKVTRTPTSGLYPAKRNPRYVLDRELTEERVAGTYNNFYEFSSGKSVWEYVDKMRLRPWTVEVTGLVEKPRRFDIDQLVRMMNLEERLYRLRCVETWAIAVPWTGFQMRDLLLLARPLSSAKYLRLTSFLNPDWAPGQKKGSGPWPYQEGLTMEEAANELTILATGIYGHELSAQHGAPIRLIVPWKYGFKSVKSIVRIEFTDRRPATFWNTVAPQAYGFEANIDPDDPLAIWSQKTDHMLGTGEERPTLLYNGYGEFVAGLYRKGS